jgi:hypothetical protein
MKRLSLFLFVLMGYLNLSAQDSNFVTIKAGYSIRDVLKTTDIFFSPKFISGKVFFKDGTIAKATMNYNSLNDQMLFIDSKGDTLAMQDEKTINFIAMDKDTFYYNEGFVRQVAANSVVKLAERKVWELADIRKMGSHNRQSNTYAVTTLRTITDGMGRTYDLVLGEDLVLRKRTSYYFADKFNHFILAGKKNLMGGFPKEQIKLSTYLKENKVNFNDREDLEKIARFIEQNN